MKPIVTEKSIMSIESDNTLTFSMGMNSTKEQIRREIEDFFGVKVEKVRTLIRKNKKYAYVKLKKDFPAIDVATKLGLI